ncbi:MAG: 16S rRNA (cytosine(1402)-N(4))-methyltransferase RsmH [Desulfobacterales bacterium]|nr:16S rRNA (cytosine(1402)-N(4))-methyltransferase RsmH [Desulfobacterales bacterium]
MLNEVQSFLNCKKGKIYVDCTLGATGHSKAILKEILPDGLLIGIDCDVNAIRNAEQELFSFQSNTILVHDNFANIDNILSKLNISNVDGLLIDLGVSLDQMRFSGRGFSFKEDEILDMRMDNRTDINAKELINNLREEELYKIFKDYGEERFSGRIARRIVEERANKTISSTKELSQIVCMSIPRKFSRTRIHPATRIFMALRIAVNAELEKLKIIMDKVSKVLNIGGRVCVISFHSLEDRIVKRKLKENMELHVITKKPLIPKEEEITSNPMSRSAKLRVAEKI